MDARRAERGAARALDAAASSLARRVESADLPRLHVELAGRLGHPAAAAASGRPEEWHLYDVLAALREAAVVKPGTEARRLWFDAVRRLRADVMSRPELVELALVGADWAASVTRPDLVLDAFGAVIRGDRANALLAYRFLGGPVFVQRVLGMYGAFKRYEPEGPAALTLGFALEQVAQVRSSLQLRDGELEAVRLEDRLEDPYDVAMVAEFAARALSDRGVDPGFSLGDRVIATSGVAGCYGAIESLGYDGDDDLVTVRPLGRCAGCITLGFQRALRVSERLEETKRQRSALAEILLSPPPSP